MVRGCEKRIYHVKNPESELFAPMRFERPKIIYNEKTEQYVLWCHFVKYPGNHGSGDGDCDMGLAVCDTVNGKYKYLGYTKPIDNIGYVRDMTVYKDFDKSAYLIYDRHMPDGDRCLHVVKLSDDYLSFIMKPFFIASWVIRSPRGDLFSRTETAVWYEKSYVGIPFSLATRSFCTFSTPRL